LSSHTTAEAAATTTTTSSSSSNGASLWKRIRDMWNSGTILMGIGGAGLTLLVVDRTLQYMDNQQARNVMAEVKDEQARKQQALFDQYMNATALFECTIKIVYKMGGTHGLSNVKQGEVVQVLQEQVGPQGHYNLCRKVDEQGNQVAIGWYPISFMEKKTSKRKWWSWT
jgi:hypothetical protein